MIPFRVTSIALALVCTASAAALPRSTPETEGVSSAAVAAFIEAVNETDGVHSFMLLRHGNVVAETWWKPYAWPDTDTLILKAYYTRTPYALTLTCVFKDDTVELKPRWNVGFGGRGKPMSFKGTLESNPSE